MKRFITWKCDVCDAVFEFDADMIPLRCPDCFSPHEHLVRAESDLPEGDIEYDDE